MRTFLIILSILAVVLAASVMMTGSSFLSQYRALSRQVDEITAHYHTGGEQHIPGLRGLPSLGASEHIAIEALRQNFDALDAAASTQDKLTAVVNVQRGLTAFFTDHTFSETLRANADFVALNEEISGRGQASALLQEYNKTVSALRVERQTLGGGILGFFLLHSEPQFLFPDGKARELKSFL